MNIGEGVGEANLADSFIIGRHPKTLKQNPQNPSNRQSLPTQLMITVSINHARRSRRKRCVGRNPTRDFFG